MALPPRAPYAPPLLFVTPRKVSPRKACAFLLAVMLPSAAPACRKTPAEPESAPLVHSKSSAVASPQAQSTFSSGTGAHRCVRPLAAVAPAIPPSAGACPEGPPTKPLAHATVLLWGRGGDRVSVEAEVVRTPEETERGLMYRSQLAEGAGMLFDLHERKEHVFWMHNTCIPLDILFIDEDGTLVGVVEASAPLDDAPRTVGCPSSRVLEVNAGWTRRHGVEPGSKVEIAR